MVKVVVGTKVCSFEEMLEEYSRVCEENEKLKSLIEEKTKKLQATKILLRNVLNLVTSVLNYNILTTN